jgi:hypothetical protein
MDKLWVFGTAAAAVALAGPALAEPSAEIRYAAARVVVIPEARSDVKVQVTVTNASLPLTVTTEGDRVIVDGGLRRRVRGCTTMFGKPTVHVAGLGQVAYDNLPQVVIRTPMTARVIAGGAVFGSIARADEVRLTNAGCGDWTIANIKGLLHIDEAGSGDVRAGTAGELRVRVAGSGDILAREIGGPIEVDVAGSGDVIAASVSGPLKAQVMGSGDVRVNAGHATEMVVRIAGSGDIRFAGVADSLSVTIAGSGDVSVDKVNGSVRKTVMGSGGVSIGESD